MSDAMTRDTPKKLLILKCFEYALMPYFQTVQRARIFRRRAKTARASF
jgi:hypothetical protein